MSAADIEIPLPAPSDPNYVYDVKTSFPSLSFFEEKIIHPAIIIPARRTAELRRTLSSVLMHRPKVKNVYNVPVAEKIHDIDPSKERKLVLTRSTEKSINDIYELPVLKELFSNTNDKNTTEGNDIRKSTFVFMTNYSHYSVEETLRKLLPSSLPEIPSAFEIVGHLAHLNLRDDCLPYKYIIGKVIMDKNAPTIKLVVNKIGNVEGEFRTFPMEIIASSIESNGETKKELSLNDDTLEVEVKEEGCRFQLNFQHVYWNSRLQFEHKRLVRYIAGNPKKKSKLSKDKNTKEETVIVADIMAGVGPFAVPLTSKYSNIQVHANDLNPRSHHYLVKNAKVNRCEDRLIPYNMDGRAFIHHLIEQNIDFDHAIMNLPAIAIEFLDAFRGYKYKKAPTVHVHCFASKDDEEAEKEVFLRCNTALGCTLNKSKDNVKIHIVRDISPRKNMLCISFFLPESIKAVQKINTEQAATNENSSRQATEPPSKKTKI